MKNKIIDWLVKSVKMKFRTDLLGEELSDGVLLLKLLHYYGVVNKKVLKHILPSNNPKVCEYNLRQLTVWFNLLDIKYDDAIISDIVKGKTRTCLKLLNDLYLALHDTKRLQFVENYERKTKETSEKESVYCSFNCNHDSLEEQDNEDILTEYLDESFLEESILDEIMTEEDTVNRISYTGANEKKPPEKKETLYDRMRNEDIQFVRNELNQYMKLAETRRLKLSMSVENTEDDEEITAEEIIRASDSEDTTTKTAKNNTVFENVIEVSEKDKEHDQLKALMMETILQRSEYEKQIAFDTLNSTYQGIIDKKRLAEIYKSANAEPQSYTNFFSSCKTSEEEIAYQLEAIDKIELHRKLYDEKIRKRNKARLLRCKQIVKDLVTLAIKISEYGKESVTNEVKLQWKQSLIVGEPILQDPDENKEEEISTINVDGKSFGGEIINHFDDYNHLIGDWFSLSGPDTSFDDLLILAQIVHRLQESRFPQEAPLKPADLCRYRITSVLNGNFDELSIIKLKSLLAKSRICIVEISSVIEFCVSQYKTEADIKPPEIPVKKKQKQKPKTDTATTNKTKSSKTTLPPAVTRQDKEIQTTSSVFEDIDKPKQLSDVAKIGMKIYNIQTSETPTDIPIQHMIDALVQFLKFQKNIEGWVLVNFPSTLQEAYFLEKAFSGKAFPEVFNILENKENGLNVSSYSQLVESEGMPCDRPIYSKLVYLPTKKADLFITYFTSFINAIKNEKLNTLENRANMLTGPESNYVSQEEATEEEEEEENILDLTAIYQEQGVNHDFFYIDLDLIALKDLARVILKCDNDVKKTPSNEVFGEEVVQFYETASTATSTSKFAKTPKQTANKKNKGKDELTVTKEFLEHLMTSQAEIASPEPDSKFGEESQKTLEEAEPEIDMFPGQEGWSYAKFPIFEDDEIALLNFWKEIEAEYITNIQHVLSVNRNNEELTTPYLNFVGKIMNVSHNTENHREKLVKNFVQYFNSALQNIKDSDVMEKLSNGAFNVERRLWEISEETRNELETQRQHAINQNWTTDRMIEIGKNYISLMEVEVNRCLSTLQFLYKYYSYMCSVQPTDHISSIQPSFFTRDWDETEINCTIAEKLTDKQKIHVLNPMCNILENADQHYVSKIKQLNSDIDYVIDIYQDFVTKNKIEYQTSKKEEESRNINQFKKPNTVSEENLIEAIPTVLQAEDIDLLEMFLEWKTAVKSELDRTKWRIKIIKQKSIETLNNLEKKVTDIFYEYYDKNITNYLKENKCIDNLCKLFHSAMNTGLPITGNIIVEDNCIYIDSEVINDSNLVDFEKNFEDELRSSCFTIDQLYVIANHLKSASTDGIIRKPIMEFLVEDMVTHEESSEGIRLFPKNWSNLCSVELKLLLYDVFGYTVKLHWKDFILYCLDLPFPDIEDIVEHKHKFLFYDKEHKGTVSYNNYLSIKFWYQLARDYTDREDYYNSVKKFLYYLFKNQDDEFDYMDFLLSFSKGETAISGFSKALASVSGKGIIPNDKHEHLGLILTEYNDLLTDMVMETLQEIVMKAMEEKDGVKIEELKESDTDFQSESILSTELEQEEIGTTNNHDKQNQTVSLTELMYDEYISKNKLYQWTSKISTDLLYTLLENRVYRVLEFRDNVINAENIKREINKSIARLEVDGEVNIPSLLEDGQFYDLFFYNHSFQIFSFASAVKDRNVRMF